MSDDARASEVTTEPSLSPSDPDFWVEALGGRSSAAWLLQDSEIDAAIRGGRVDVVYKLFRKRLSAAPTVEAHAALEATLANRRLFLESLQVAPSLSTLNGIGARTYGSQDRNPKDGTYITTRFLTVLNLPLWPLAQYLVVKAPGRGWHFLGRVPLSAFHRWWRRAVLLGCAALVVVSGLSAWRRKTTSEVHFLNGLPVPVAVTMGDEVVEIGAGARQTRAMRVGRHRVTARGPDGVVLEERDVDVPHGRDFVAYNVLGSAPLVLETIGYSAEGADTARSEELTQARSLAGESWVVQEAVDWLFRAAPRSIRMPSGTLTVKKRRLDVYAGDWRTAATHLALEARMPAAASLARTASRLLPGNDDALALALVYSRQAGEADAVIEFLEEGLATRPDDIQLHRGYQEVLKNLDRLDEILPIYRAAYEANPHSARAAYLYARILDMDGALPIYEALVSEHPEDPWLVRGLGWVYYLQGRFDDALPYHTQLLVMRPDEAGYFARIVALELAAAGRVFDALRVVGDMLDAAPERVAQGLDPLAGSDAWTLVGLFARLRRLVPNPAGIPDAAARWRPFLSDGGTDVDLLARTAARARDVNYLRWAHDAVLSPETLAYCKLTLLSQTALGEAGALALKTDEGTLLSLDDEVQLAIACELLRQEERAAAERLLGGLSPMTADEIHVDDLDALPSLEGLPEDLEPVMRATLLVAASRREENEGRRTALLEEARHLDVLRLVVPE